MFSEAYKNLCIENAEKLREEWEPKYGDWAWRRDVGEFTLTASQAMIVKGESFPAIWLPTPRQLIRMLEERGYGFCLYYNRRENKYWLEAGCDKADWRELHVGRCLAYEIQSEGPHPETALLRCLMEVMKDDATLP